MPHPNQAPLDFGGMTPREYAQPRPGEMPFVQPPTPPTRPQRPPDPRGFFDRYSDAALAGATAAAPAALAAGGIASAVGTPIAGAATAGLLAGGGALGGIVEQGVRDIAPQWSEDYPWLAPTASILATAGIGGAARGVTLAAQHAPAIMRATGIMGLAQAVGGIHLAAHVLSFGTLLPPAAILYGIKRAATDPARAAATFIAPPLGALAERGRNWLMQPSPPPPPAAEAEIPLRPYSPTLPRRGTRLEMDPGAGQ